MMVQRLGSGDLPEICAIEEACFSRPWSAESLRSALDAPGALALGYRQEGRLAGYALAEAVIDTAELRRLAVLPGMRQRGVGLALVLGLLGALRERGCSECFLELRRSNLGAMALYRRAGFAEIGLRRDYYTDPEEDAVILRAEIK